MVCRTLVLVAALGLSFPGVGWAADTGSISGIVFDQTGTPLAGVTVRVTGDVLPAGRSVTTGDNGLYTLQRLLPGKYTVEAGKTGGGKTTRVAIVEVDRDTQLDLVVGLTVQEALTVVAATPVVDMKSTEVSFNYKTDMIEALPLQRTYAGLFQLIPGVAENGGFAPNAGGSRQDNTFLIDGVNITNPLFGYLSTEVNELDIAEFNVKRGGITAEFGRSSGFVANAVTRSGTNQLRGSVRFEAIPAGWLAKSDKQIRSTRDQWVPAFGVGGPLVRDRIFFYASGRIYRATETDRVNNVGPIPDRKIRTNEVFGKITAQLGNAQFFNVGYRHRPSKDQYAGVGVNSAPEVATNSEGTNRVATVEWSWFPASRTVVDVRYLHMKEANESVPVTDLGFQPTFDPNNLVKMGNFTSGGITRGGDSLRLNRSNYRRDEVKLVLTQFLDFAGANHQLKAGFGWEDSSEDLTRKSNGWGIVSYVQNNTRIQATYYPDQPAQLGIGRTYSLFAQDDITLTDRLVVNAGVLLNRDEFSQKTDQKRTFLTFNFFDEVQPRLGVNYNLRKGKGDKVYANWGRYFNLDQKSSARSLAPRRLYTSDALFDLSGTLLSDTPSANTVSKVIDPEIEAPYINEYLAGYATPLRGNWNLDAFFMFRDANRFIEDAPTVLPFSNFVYANLPAAERRYRALTFELNRLMANRWSATVSYSFSKYYGNLDIDYSGGLAGAQIFNTSSLLEDGPGSFVEDRFREGVLTQDRPHVLKVFATYMPEFLDGLTFSGYVRAQSGTPWEARGLPWGSTLTYLRYLEPAGTNRTDSWTNFDFLAAYRLKLPRNAGFKIEGRVLNLFNAETALLRDNRKYLDGRIRAFTSTPGPDCDRACYTDLMVQGTTQPNPAYGQPTAYATPRRFLLTLLVDF